MRLRETVPAWVVRQVNRRAARYADDKVVRWIALPLGKAHADGPAGPAASCNDNVVPFPRASMSRS